MTTTTTANAQTAAILALRSQDEHEDLLVAHRRWAPGSDQNPAAQAALDADDYDGFVAALGTPVSVTLTTDGRHVNTDAACHCVHLAGVAARYERWTAAGRVECGWACPDCRGVIVG